MSRWNGGLPCPARRGGPEGVGARAWRRTGNLFTRPPTGRATSRRRRLLASPASVVARSAPTHVSKGKQPKQLVKTTSFLGGDADGARRLPSATIKLFFLVVRVVFTKPVFLLDCRLRSCYHQSMRIVPKSAGGCGIASFCCLLAVLCCARWEEPDWCCSVAVFLTVAYAVAAVVRAFQWLSAPKPPDITIVGTVETFEVSVEKQKDGTTTKTRSSRTHFVAP